MSQPNRGPCHSSFYAYLYFYLTYSLCVRAIAFVVIHASFLYCQPILTASGAPTTYLNQSK